LPDAQSDPSAAMRCIAADGEKNLNGSSGSKARVALSGKQPLGLVCPDLSAGLLERQQCGTADAQGACPNGRVGR